ncbi:protein NinF [Pluralibacter sp.]|uniref:protein NinF n=1 Tax=Pluralibacter sp. TaxID=1920032 RepID=UPI0025EB204D|nr:protein NinF [Pluralibacter sp.]MBV8045103.1 protein ninF [Pluralibacter sp.]
MLSPHEAQSYEQQSIRRALECANCGKQLHILEVHVCELCCAELLSEPNEKMTEEDDE